MPLKQACAIVCCAEEGPKTGDCRLAGLAVRHGVFIHRRRSGPRNGSVGCCLESAIGCLMPIVAIPIDLAVTGAMQQS